MTEERRSSFPFNSPFETGIRSVGILVAAYPRAFDLQRLVAFDHLVVHTGDIGGPKSLHPELPMRSAELLVRRGLIERGLLLMMSRGLVERVIDNAGISYRAGDFAATFLTSLSSSYLISLRERAEWIAENFADLREDEVKTLIGTFFDKWIEQFQAAQRSLAGEL